MAVVAGEASPLGWTIRVDAVAVAVDGDVVVVPTQRDQIVVIMIPTVRAFLDVVGF